VVTDALGVFKEADGPTALRRDLVHALSFSEGIFEVELGGGEERCCAALAGVWNGKKGFVAILIRGVEPASLRRFVYEESLRDPGHLLSAVEAGLAFASSLGITMDSFAFAELDDVAQGERMDEWNQLRKLSGRPRALRLDPAASQPQMPAPITADERGGAVLGRLSLVRKRGNYKSPLGRLLSYF